MRGRPQVPGRTHPGRGYITCTHPPSTGHPALMPRASASLFEMGHPRLPSARQPKAWCCLSRSRKARSPTGRVCLPNKGLVWPVGHLGRQGLLCDQRWQGIRRQGAWGYRGIKQTTACLSRRECGQAFEGFGKRSYKRLPQLQMFWIIGKHLSRIILHTLAMEVPKNIVILLVKSWKSHPHPPLHWPPL